MRVEIDDAVAVGPTNSFGETEVVVDTARASIRTPRGGVIARPNDFNPERVVVDDLLVPLPAMNVGDHYTSPVDRAARLRLRQLRDRGDAGADGRPRRRPARVDDGGDGESARGRHLQRREPGAVRSGVEVQPARDDRRRRTSARPTSSRSRRCRTTAARPTTASSPLTQTLGKLIAAIQAAGGPRYDYREIDPVDDQDGGQPGGNIRVVFLFRTDRGLALRRRARAAPRRPPTASPAAATCVYQPRPGRSREPGLGDEPQAAGRRVHLARPASCS